MYGMVNEGVRTFIQSEYGDEAWTEICNKAKLDRHEFERMTSYDDATTYALVGAISDYTNLPAEDVLRVFGKFWIEFVGESNFGDLLRVAGRNFVERVQGLDDMHDRILLSMPHLKPPSFDLQEIDDSLYHLHYYSEREGLAPMVIGLLHGIADLTDERIEARHLIVKSPSADHDVFEITLAA